MFVYCVCVCQYKEGKKLKPKPNYNSVDLSEVEWEDTEEKVSEMSSFFLNDVFFLLYLSVSCIFKDLQQHTMKQVKGLSMCCLCSS